MKNSRKSIWEVEHAPRIGLVALLVAFAPFFACIEKCTAADEQTNEMNRLANMSIDELLNQPVTTVSRRPEKLSQSPAAITVLTQEDIQRSGARSIPEALRYVPGMDVAQVDSQQWAVSVRGFNDVFANKLLVLQDGRSLYTPLFSGVFWDVQNPVLEDIDRIEVIRGPGASLWGANAVNGVINIITKSAADTQGFLATAGGGNYEQDFVSGRYGGKLADDVYYRIDGQYFDRGDSVSPGGGDAHDAWRLGQGGFRIDWDTLKKGGNLVTLQGDIYQGRMDQVFNAAPMFFPPTTDLEKVGGGNILGRWTHQWGESNEVTMQMYYDRSDRDSTIFSESLDTFDIDVQHHFSLGEEHRNDFVWGLGCRLSYDHIGNTQTAALSPSNPMTRLYSAFLQDEITILPDQLRLTLGTKLEHNNYTGFEVQPDARILWTPAEHHTVWASVSRAVRTPSEAEEFVQLNQLVPAGVFAPSPVPVTINGNPNMRSEDVLAYQFGYRMGISSNLWMDMATFYNVYRDLRGEEILPVPGPMVQILLDNAIHGDSYGVELAPTWEVIPGWRLGAAYSFLEMQLKGPNTPSEQFVINMDVGSSPEQQFSLRSSVDLPHNLSLDCALRFVDRLETPLFRISSYVAFDTRLAWRPGKHWELALVGQNLGPTHHAEFAPTFIGTQPTEVRASGYAKITVFF